MCNALGLIASIAATDLITGYSSKKAKKQANATINAANQAAANQVEQNKLANSVQTTEKETETQTAIKKLATQKVPLNTTNTGATVGTPSSVGLNLGGY